MATVTSSNVMTETQHKVAPIGHYIAPSLRGQKDLDLSQITLDALASEKNYSRKEYPSHHSNTNNSSYNSGNKFQSRNLLFSNNYSRSDNSYPHNGNQNRYYQNNKNNNNNMNRRNPQYQDNERGFGGRRYNRYNESRTSTGTEWDKRNGRQWSPESEHEVFDDKDNRVSVGINFNSYSSIPVDLIGNGSKSIAPFTSFKGATKIHPLLQQNLLLLDYENPTPVQKYSIPVILEGRDLMACAQTGSGKTAAFLYPIISRMLSTGPPPNQCIMTNNRFKPVFPVTIILSPTRELAMQTFKESRKFAFHTGIETHVVYGGSPFREQSLSLQRRGTDICVATPGRLLELIERSLLDLRAIQYLVLDEADRMLDMGFTPQIDMIIKEKNMTTSEQGRQTIMFSATFPGPIQRLAATYLNNYIFLTVGRIGSTNDFIQQEFIYATENNKQQQLLKVLNVIPQGLVLIFVETKRKADIIENFLHVSGFHAVSLHGDKSQPEREEALRSFRTGNTPILVATDVAARGLDINNISHVIQYDLPSRIDDYVHRIGRTGRAGNAGKATSFICEQNKPIFRDLLALLEQSQQVVSPWFYKLISSCDPSQGHYQTGYNDQSNMYHNRHYNHNSGNYNRNNNFNANKNNSFGANRHKANNNNSSNNNNNNNNNSNITPNRGNKNAPTYYNKHSQQKNSFYDSNIRYTQTRDDDEDGW